MPRLNPKLVGVILCVAAVAVVIGAWLWARSTRVAHTDNAYVRGDITSLSAKVSGYVMEVAIADNQAVRAGDLLFRIDDRDHRARLAQAEANVGAARARLANVEAETRLQHSLVRQARAQRRAIQAEFDLATRVSDRRRDLIRTHAVSQALLDESEAGRSRSEAGLLAATASVQAQEQRVAVLLTQKEAAIAALAQAVATRDLAQIDLDNTVVRAPVSGVIGNRQVRVGRLVAPGVALLDLVPLQSLWVVANFKETQLEHLRRGQPVRISVDGYPSVDFAGVVDSIAPGSGSSFSLLPSDNATGNFVRVVQRVPVKIRFADDRTPAGLVPGLSARVVVDRGT